MKTGFRFAFSFIIVCIGITFAHAQNFVRLKDGQVIKCAVLRMDTSAVITTDWEYRGLAMPPLNVYARDEVQSVWFMEPSESLAIKIPYVPHPEGWEAGGSFSLQTFLAPGAKRRLLGVVSGLGSFTLLKPMSLEVDADFTFPFAAKNDPWSTYSMGYQISMSVVGHPFIWHGIVPFALAGAGASNAIPLGNLQLNAGGNMEMLNAGLGIKWGAGGVGYRIEWRHCYYLWSIGPKRESADASSIRASVFIYR
jgi:hypothetical protein